MKKASVIVLVLLLTAGAETYAQGFHIGVKGGVNLGNISGDAFKNGTSVGYALGGFAEINFNKWGIQPEVLWNQLNTKTSDNFGITYEGVTGQNISLNYLSIPILLTYKVVPMLSLQFGPQFGTLINQSDNLFDNGKNAFSNGDISLVGGAQLNLLKLKVGLRYFGGISNVKSDYVKDLNNENTWKNHGFQLYVGFRII